MIRGIRAQIEMFEKFMQAQMFPWKRRNLKTGKWETMMVQGALRDSGPFKEYVFPKEALQEVLDMLEIDWKSNITSIGDFKKFWMRRLIGHGLRKTPKKIITPIDYPRMSLVAVDENGKATIQNYRYIEKRGIDIIIIGIKDDKMQDFPQFGYHQEAL